MQRFAAVIMRIREPKTTALIFASGKMVSSEIACSPGWLILASCIWGVLVLIVYNTILLLELEAHSCAMSNNI